MGDLRHVEQPERNREPDAYRSVKAAEQDSGENRLE